ncbi:MAG: hypothetical protein HY875_10815 [Chloroflexi bacterium]|nr:hypothetical protein [Chloroflexota bacterium]
MAFALILGSDPGTQADSTVGAQAARPFKVVVPAVANDSGEPAESQAAAAKRLAETITHGRLAEAVEAVQEALSRSGVATGDLTQTFVAARAPATPQVAIPLEVLKLATDAHDGSIYRLTADDLGQMLADFGWPFAASSTPGEQVVAMLATLITGAQQSPQDPVSFGLLFLEELALLRDPAVDLATGTAAPGDVRFNLLQLQTIVSFFDRVSVKPGAALAQSAGVVAADPVDVCSEAQKVLSGVLSPFGGQVTGMLTGEAGPLFVEKGLVKAGASQNTAQSAGKALAALSIVSKLWKLAEFYSSVQVSVEVEGTNLVHKELDTEVEQTKQFNATAGVSEDDWNEYKAKYGELGSTINRAVRDCLNQFGLGMLADLGEIAKEAENWKIDWTVSQSILKNSRGEENAFWRPEDQIGSWEPHLGKVRSSLKRTSEFSAGASFVLETGPERVPDHPGTEKLDQVTVCGDVVSGSPPPYGPLVNATKGIAGLIDAIAELGAGWLMTVATPQSCARLGVTYHEYCPALGPVATAAAVAPTPLPCEWNGSISGTMHHQQGNGLVQDWQGEATVKFRLKSVVSCDGCQPSYTYELESGQATWQETGKWGISCTYSRSGTDPIPWGGLSFAWEGSGQWRYNGWAQAQLSNSSVCDGPNNGVVIWNWFNIACIPSPGPAAYSGSGDVSGSCTQSSSFGSVTQTTETYHWRLSEVACLPSVGAAAAGSCGP